MGATLDSRAGRALQAALVLACVLGLAGCGGGDDSPEPAATETIEQAPASKLRERFDSAVAELLEQRGLSAEVVECALAELATTVDDEAINAATEQIRQTGTPPPEFTEAAAAAGQACSGP